MELEEKRLISRNEREAVGGRINKLIEAFLWDFRHSHHFLRYRIEGFNC
jgi:hypothetical protein